MPRDNDATNDDAASRTSATVVAVFPRREDAEAAVRALLDAGFREEQLGAAILDQNEQERFTESTGASGGAIEGATKGAMTGGVIGGLIGLLGSLLIPGIGPIVAGGVLASTLAGAAAGAATGGLIGALIGMGTTEEEARYFEDRFKEGDVLIAVDAPGRTAEARDILGEYDGDLGPTHRRYADTLRTAPTEADDDVEEVEVVLIEEDVLYAPAWDGNDRRVRPDPTYSGPERRLAGV